MADLLGKLFTSTDSNKSAKGNHDNSNETPHYDFEANIRAFSFGMVCLQGFLITTYFLEWCLSRRRHRLPDSIGNVLHHINAHMSLLASIVIVWYWIEIPPLGACLLFNAVIVWMKLLSYVLANEDYRASWVAALVEASDASLTSSSVSSSPSSEPSATLGGQNTTTTNAIRAYDAHQATLALIDSLDSDDLDIAYPRNITLMNIYYFWLAPTLTYQIAFPKTPRVRFFKVIGILIRMVLVFSLFVFFSVQVVGPTLEHLLTDLEATQGRYTLQILADYWLKLTITNTYLWLLMFYFYFHLYLNLFAELLRFGDRVFYKDWWNSVEVSAYWRLWNLPVHYWMVRHLYFPCVRRNISKTGATFLVFFFSAVVHELLVSIPFHMLRPWLFWGMMGQFPLIFISKWFYRQFPGSSIGNIIFWLSFCVVGQPMAIMMYTIDFKYGKLHQASGSATASGVAAAALAELAEKVMGSMVDPAVSEL